MNKEQKETTKAPAPAPEVINEIDTLVAKYQDKFLSVKQVTKNAIVKKYRDDHAKGGKLFSGLSFSDRYEIMKTYINSQEKKTAPNANKDTDTINVSKALKEQFATAPKGQKTRLINSVFKTLTDQAQPIKLDINQAILLVESLQIYATKDIDKDIKDNAEQLVILSTIADKFTKAIADKEKQSKAQLIKEYEAKLKQLKG